MPSQTPRTTNAYTRAFGAITTPATEDIHQAMHRQQQKQLQDARTLQNRGTNKQHKLKESCLIHRLHHRRRERNTKHERQQQPTTNAFDLHSINVTQGGCNSTYK